MDLDNQINDYMARHENFAGVLNALKEIITGFPFEETVKWGRPTYAYDGKNLLGIGAFKHHAAMWFFQGALLNDPDNMLNNAQEGKTKAMRQMQFRDLNDIDREIIEDFLRQTIDNQNKGLVVPVKMAVKKVSLPAELKSHLDRHPEVAEHFYKLSPGRQNEYGGYISEAKREQTKLSRLQKITPMIQSGKGLYDKYKNC